MSDEQVILNETDNVDNSTYYDVIIIGAGVSGLSAAYKIFKKDVKLSIAILEANDRVGGRTVGQKMRGLHGDDHWDLGGQWIGTCQLEVMALLDQLDLSLYGQYNNGKRLLQVGNATVAKEYDGDIPRLSWTAIFDLYLFISKLEGMMELLSTDNQALFHQWDAMTMKSFIDRKLWTREARESIEAALRVIFGCETCHLSLLYLLRYANSAGGFGPLISEKTMYGAQEMKVKGGTFQICVRLAEVIGMDKVHLNQRVTHIAQDSDEVKITTSDNKVFKCRKLIVTNPPMQRSRIVFNPPLPETTTHVLKRMPAGRITKVIVTYATTFWRDSGFSGSVVTNGGRVLDEDGCWVRGPLCLIYDATSADGNPALVTFIGGQQHLEHSAKSAEERKKVVLESLCTYFGAFCLEPLDYAEKNWSSVNEAFMDGGPVSVGTPGTGQHIHKALTDPFMNIHFAGTESATYWCGFINGAVESGYRAAVETLHLLRSSCVDAEEFSTCRYRSARQRTVVSSATRFRADDEAVGNAGFSYAVTVVTAAAAVLIAKKLYNRFGAEFADFFK